MTHDDYVVDRENAMVAGIVLGARAANSFVLSPVTLFPVTRDRNVSVFASLSLVPPARVSDRSS